MVNAATPGSPLESARLSLADQSHYVTNAAKVNKSSAVANLEPVKKKTSGKATVVKEKRPLEEIQRAAGLGPRAPLWQYPKGVFFILAHQFFERFTQAGLRIILTMYLMSVYNFQDEDARILFHMFVVLLYIFPILGAIAESYSTRLRIIVILSAVYVVGLIPPMFTSLRPSIWSGVFDSLSFIVISLAVGGTRPCLFAFAGSQFPANMVAERKCYATIFYSTFTAGALFSYLITPMMRTTRTCGVSEGDCFAACYWLLFASLFIATVVLYVGIPFYNVNAVAVNNSRTAIYCIKFAICHRMKNPWADWSVSAKGTFSDNLIRDVRRLMRITCLFACSVPFFTLYDQLGSTWLLQARLMDRKFCSILIQPGQMAVLNPLCILIFAPLFDNYLYPKFRSRDMLVKPLRRMAWGGNFLVLCYICAAILQSFIDRSLVDAPGEAGKYLWTFINVAPCRIQLQSEERTDIIYSNADLKYVASNPLHLKYRNLCYGLLTDDSNIYEPNITYQDDSNITYYVIRALGQNFGHVVTFWSDDYWSNYTIASYDITNQISTGSRLLLTIDPFLVEQLKNDYDYLIEAHDSEETSAHESANLVNLIEPNGTMILTSKFRGSDSYDIYLKVCPPKPSSTSINCTKKLLVENLKAELGSTSIIVINREWKVSIYEQLVPPFSVHILWQIPQYLLLTLAEILFCITGQEFSFSEAGEGMRSIVLAFWYATVAIGNLLIMLLSLFTVHFGRTGEFVFYAALMSLCLMIFIIFASHYKYLEIDRFGNVRKETDEDSRSSYEISCHL